MAGDATDGRLDGVLRALADRVRDLRNERGLSIATLAFEAGMSQSRVRAIEAGRTAASLATLVALAETFEIDVSDLFGPRPATPSGRQPHRSPHVVPSEVVWGGELPPAPWKTASAAPPHEAPSAYVVPSEVVWGGELPPAPWTSARAAPVLPEPAVPSADETVTAHRTRVASLTIGAGELPPAPWMPVVPPPVPVAASAPTNAIATPRSHDTHTRALAQRVAAPTPRETARPAPGRRDPRTFADLRDGVLNDRVFGSLQEFAVAAVVEGRFPLGAVARVFRLPTWRLEQWVIESGGLAR